MRHTKQCPVCGDQYQTKRKRQTFCSYTCSARSRSKRKQKICEGCGAIIDIDWSKKHQHTKRFCTQQCFFRFKNRKHAEASKTIQAYREKHTLADTMAFFGYSKAKLRYHNVIGADAIQRLTCPDKLTKTQQSCIIGNLLGDGYISTRPANRNGNSLFSIIQERKRYEYIKHLQTIYRPFSKQIKERATLKPTRIDGKVVHDNDKSRGKCHSYRLRTISHPIFTDLRHRWYNDNRKIVPPDIVLCPETVAIWACDDGTRRENGAFRFYTDSFTFDEVELLIHRFNVDLGIVAKINKRLGKPILALGVDAGAELRRVIAPHVVDCFKYKVA